MNCRTTDTKLIPPIQSAKMLTCQAQTTPESSVAICNIMYSNSIICQVDQ